MLSMKRSLANFMVVSILAAGTLPPLAMPAAASTAVAAPARATRIVFPAGGTSATRSGALAAGGIKEYVLKAMKNQTMIVSVTSPRRNVFLEIYGLSDGIPLVRLPMGAASWKGKLPGTQDYSIKVISTAEPMPGAPATRYTLKVSVPSPAPSAIRVRFPLGATSISYEGSIKPSSISRYIIAGRKGSLLMVDVTSPGETVHLSVVGARDGKPLISSMAGATSFEGKFPATQDYYINVVATGARQTHYSLNVEIPHRIVFERGATSAEVDGVDANGRNAYVLKALAGQTMSVNIVSDNNAVKLTIYGLDDGQPLVRAASDASSWSGQLPATQDYVILAVPTGEAHTYTLQVEVK